MKKISKILLLSVSFFVVICVFYKFKNSLKIEETISAQIIESNAIEDVKKFAEQDTLFIFDYDNVLVEGKEDYGFDAWFCSMFAELEKSGLSKADVKAKLLPVYEEIQRTAQVQTVELCTKNLIEDLRKDGHKVMILTVRSLCLIETVFRQLKSVEIDIERGAISEDGINSDLCNLGSKYVNGILFCDCCAKGPALKTFLLGHPDLKIKKIVFVDDKMKNIESVKSTAQEMGIKFVGIRYGRTDERAKAFRLDSNSLQMAEALTNQDVSQKTGVPNELQVPVVA